MAIFGLSCEGVTDQAVLENILCGFYQDYPDLDEEIQPLQPPYPISMKRFRFPWSIAEKIDNRKNMPTNTDTATTSTMNGESLNIAEQRQRELKQLFPAAFTETVNEAGELVTSVDFERLKAEIGAFSDIFESRRERYGMDWPGKREALRLIQQPSRATLKPCREESVDFDHTENLFIEGDNLEVLKLLQKAYYGKVKMIYIDPPYNTGKEFIYPDKYAESLETYLAYAGLMDDEGKKFSTNTAAEGRFHTKWLNMMYPRLYLARNLLRDDGVIFISIDDHEQSNLKTLCDEIFGEENFINNIIWQKKYSPANDAKWLSDNHDFILCYAKNKNIWRPNLLPRDAKATARYKNPDNDPRGSWKATDFSVKTYSSSCDYMITTPSGRTVSPPDSRCWVANEKKYKELVSDNRIWFGSNGNNVPSLKKFLSEVKDGITPLTVWTYKEVGHNQAAKQEVKTLFVDNQELIFDTPKPVSLMSRLLKIGSHQDSIVMDFFAGSASFAHGVLSANLNDNGNRKCISIQLPEKLKATNNLLSKVAVERIRRAAKKIQQENPDYNGDLGFKVLKLDQSNFKHWQAPKRDIPDDVLKQQLELHIDHIQENAEPEDILYELLIKAGFMPTEKIDTLTLAGKTVYAIAEGELLICLENSIDNALIQAIADKEPTQFICLDKAFHGNDQLKANAVQTFKSLNQDRDSQIEFRTV